MLRTITNIIGILLVIAGIMVLIYKGFTYKDQETVAKLGEVELSATTTNYVYLSPVYGGIALVAGVILIVAARRK